MIGKIINMDNNAAYIEATQVSSNLINMHVIFEDTNKKVLGEVESLENKIIKIRLLGEIVNNQYIGGVIRKPSLESTVRIISEEELKIIVGEDNEGSLLIGNSALYNNCKIFAKLNDMFSNHLAVFGNSGSGKSFGVSRLLQNIFHSKNFSAFRSNILIFDTFGEYHNALNSINQVNSNYNFKYFTTNKRDTSGYKLQIPVWLLDVDDLAILLQASEHAQLTILDEALKLVKIFSSSSEIAIKYKNHLIATAIMSILYSNQNAASKRNEVFSIFNTCTTDQFNLEAELQGIGYTRKFRDCFLINDKDNFSESVLLSEYLQQHIDPTVEQTPITEENHYTLKELEAALNFTLISEGLLKNEKMYSTAITLKVRIHSIINGPYAEYFDMPSYLTKEQYISSLVTYNNTKAQIINFNLEEVEDWFTRFVTKYYSRLLFEFLKNIPQRAAVPFHIFLEEAHRYVKDDTDNFLIGYNIFERIAKEGRKHGLMLNIISQRPIELSDTVISQLSNFFIFKITHPLDLEYIKKMLPNMSEEIIEKLKTLQPGTCMAFGKAFKIPMIIRMELPNPTPASSNCDIVNTWK